jgi:hypothetical protein
VARLGGTRRNETKLMGGAHASVRGERKSIEDRKRKPKRKMYFERKPRVRRPDVPAERGGGRRARSASLGELGWIPGEDSRKFWFLNFKDFRNLIELGEILQGDLEGIWTWRFFLNSSWLLKDF